VKTPQTLEEFMARALAIETEAAQRYEEFADAMQTHNNPEVAQMFRTMAGYEAKHAAQIMAEMGWKTPPAVPLGGWPSFEPPESVPNEQVHYLMKPWHALQLALQAEQRAEAFFAELARVAPDGPVREAALKLQAEEREHVELVQAWLAKVPVPDRDWETDPDPPRLID
jgi:rubrerythrin